MGRLKLLLVLLLYSGIGFSQSPGGVSSNLTFWYNSTHGTSTTTNGATITSWDDQTTNGLNATENAPGPTYLSVASNYNPGVDFAGTSGGLIVPDNNSINTSSFTAKSYSIAFVTGNDVSAKQMLYEQGGGGTGMNVYIDGGFLYVNLWISSVEYSGSTPITTHANYVFSYVFDGGNTRIDAWLNGSQVLNNIPAPSTLSSHGGDPGMGLVNGNTQYVGDVGTSGLEPFSGQVLEMAYYNNHVYTASERNRIESYLAFKYGIGLSTNYIASDGSTTFWNTTTNAGYLSDVAGIGRDNLNSDINQKQSRSEGPGGLIAIGLGSIETDNASNTNNFTNDKDFMVWGSNGGSNTFTSVGAPTGSLILERQWKIQETSSVGTVRVSVPSNNSSATNKLPAASLVKILVDSDGDFSSGATSTSMILVGDNWETSIDFSNGQYFTFAVEGASLDVTTNGDETGPVDIVYTVTLTSTNTTGSAITFDINDAGTGSATSGLDYTPIPANAKISVANGLQTGSYTVSVTDDALEENQETLIVTISNPSDPGTTIGTSSAIATIDDNDNAIPGGVSTNLTFWLKADNGTSTSTEGDPVTAWTDKSQNTNDASAVTTSPLYRKVIDNFNPALDYTSNTGGFTMADNAEINTGGSNFTAKSYSISFKTGSDITTRQVVYEQGGGGTGMNIYIESGSLFFNLYRGNTDYSGSTAISANTSYVVSFVYDGGNSRWDAYLNGAASPTVNNTSVTNTLTTHSGDIGIGVIDNTTQFNGQIDVSSGESFLGYLMEMAYYNDIVFNSTNRNQLESYLGLKYGTTLASNYLASDGSTVFWNSAGNSGYLNHIAGIGLDETSGLNQKQSKSNSSGALVTMGLGSIASDNASNSGSHSADQSFLVWGSDNGAVSFTASGAPAGDQIIARTWKVQETGTVGAVRIRVPDNNSIETTKIPNASSLNILVDADGDFSAGATATSMTLNGTYWEADIDFSTGQFFTFSTGGASLSVTTHGSETGPVNIVYTVSLLNTNNSGSNITFDLTDAGTGTATSGSDYAAIPGGQQITVANGSQTGTYTLVVNDDAFEEGTETVTLNISNPSPPTISIGTPSATANITDDDFSTPGGVSSNLVYWLKADKQVTTASEGATVTAMVDQAFNGNNASEVSPGPTYDEILTNFNPAINFTSVSGGLTMANDVDINASNSSAKSFTIVFKTGSDINTRQVIYEQGGGTNGLNLYINSGSLFSSLWVNSAEDIASTSISANTDYIYTFVYNGGANRWDGYLNGSLVMSDASAVGTLNSHTGAIGIGVISSTTQFSGNVDVASGEGFLGEIMEIAYYNAKVFTALERRQIETTMAIRYGITFPDNYTVSDGSTVLWNPTNNSAYHNDVAVIGKDGISGVDQKQSKSINSDALVTIGLGNIATSNTSNINTFGQERSFLAWGNDNGALAGATDNSELTAQSGAVDQLKRNWKLEETGSVGTVQIAFPQADIDSYFSYSSYSNIYLRVADDASFITNVVDTPLTQITINGVPSYAGTFDFNGTKYFTVVQTGFILWTGSEWRGGLSNITNHAPSDEAGEAGKTLYITANSVTVNEGVSLTNAEISSGATLNMGPNSCLILSGTIINSGTLNFEADASGYAQYNGPATNARFEQYVDNEGWHNIGSPFSDAVWDDFSFLNNNGQINHPLEGTSLDTCSYCNVWYYDPTTDIGSNIGFGSSTAYGTWRSSTNGSEQFKADRGWNLYLDGSSNFGTAPWTFSINGVFNAGNITQIANENNGGWNLVANPYPSTLDWDVVDNELAAEGIALGYHIWDHANSNYATYLSGSGTLGANQYIAPFQGYYIQTAIAGGQGSGDVNHSFTLSNSDRTTTCQTSGNFFKTTPDHIKIRTTHLGSGKVDETLITFEDNSSHLFNPMEDANKLFSTSTDISSLYSRVGDHYVSISSINYPTERDNVLLGVKARENQSISIELMEFPDGWTVYLEDLKTGFWYGADQLPYVFNQDNSIQDRFMLYFHKESFEAGKAGGNPFSAYVSDGQMVIEAERSILNSSWQLISITGALIKNGAVNLTVGEKEYVDLSNLGSGIYILTLESRGTSYSQKIPYAR